MDQFNPKLAVILDQAAEIQESRTPRVDPGSALRNAVMNYVERDLGLPVLVKYGEARAVRGSHGRPDSRVWEAAPEGDHTLFYVEPVSELSDDQESELQDVFVAIGAWHIGTTGMASHQEWTHHLYAWPDDHPVLDLLPHTPTDTE